jgi:uncharacterized SAM-binding protein YcdF (DUF218 family)
MLLVGLLAIACVVAFRRQGTTLWRLRWVLLALLVATDCVLTPAIASALLSSLEDRYPPVPTATIDAAPKDAPLILVLSSGLTIETRAGWVTRLDAAGWERTYAGIGLWHAVGGELLFVGQPTPDGRSSVAEVMRDVAIASGVPAAAVRVETRSRNTYENLAFSRALAAAHGEHLWLVTSALHMRRALAVAHKLGLSPRPYACDYRAIPLLHWYAWLPDLGGAGMFSEALHEWIGLAYYRLKGYA